MCFFFFSSRKVLTLMHTPFNHLCSFMIGYWMLNIRQGQRNWLFSDIHVSAQALVNEEYWRLRSCCSICTCVLLLALESQRTLRRLLHWGYTFCWGVQPWLGLPFQLVKNLPATRETRARSLGWEDPLEKGKVTHSSVLAWRIPWTVYSMGLQRVRPKEWLSVSDHDLVSQSVTFFRLYGL